MNILTKNRILQAGDEYQSNGAWKPVPDTDYGLQVEFTKYTAVRRPSEKPTGNITLTPPQQGSQVARQESAKLPIAGSIPAPASPPVPAKAPKPLSETYSKAKPKPPLPTVVSKKAHGRIDPRISVDVVIPVIKHGTPILKAAEELEATRRALAAVAAMPKEIKGKIGAPDEISIKYSDLSALPNWIGRNGTFKAKAIRLKAMKNGLIQIRPEGSRGLAKNALIEFPATEIPQVIDWLLRHQPAPTPK